MVRVCSSSWITSSPRHRRAWICWVITRVSGSTATRRVRSSSSSPSAARRRSPVSGHGLTRPPRGVCRPKTPSARFPSGRRAQRVIRREPAGVRIMTDGLKVRCSDPSLRLRPDNTGGTALETDGLILSRSTSLPGAEVKGRVSRSPVMGFQERSSIRAPQGLFEPGPRCSGRCRVPGRPPPASTSPGRRSAQGLLVHRVAG